MTVQPQAPNQAPKSSRDYMQWRTMYNGPEQSQENLDFWNMLRKRSVDAQSIIGEMPFVFEPNRLVGPPTAANPAPGGTMPSQFEVQQSIRPGSQFPSGTGAQPLPTFTPQMRTDLLGALQSLTGKPGFEQLGPLLALLGKG
jgi:hypothetical protein